MGTEKQPDSNQSFAELMTDLIKEATALRAEVKRLGEKSQGVEERDPESDQVISWTPDHPNDEEISELAQRLKIFVPKLRDTLAPCPSLGGTREMIEQLPLVARLIDVMVVLFYPLDLNSALSGTWPTAVHNLATITALLENALKLNPKTERQPDNTSRQSTTVTSAHETGARERFPSIIESPDAARKMATHVRSKGMGLREFAAQVKTTDRTLRSFRKTGKVRRDIFESIAKAMGITKEDLMKPE